MNELFEIFGQFTYYFISFLEMLGRYFSIAIDSFSYAISAVLALPFYMKSFVLALLGLAVALMILNRGT